MPGIDFQQIFGTEWEESALNLARYYGKHFGCRMMRSGLPVPDSLRQFLDGAVDMPDAHMALITTDSVHEQYDRELSISPDFVHVDPNFNRFTRYVLAAYVGRSASDKSGGMKAWPSGHISSSIHIRFLTVSRMR
jgi:hypothetical protein